MIIGVTGPSGAGKTTLLRAFEARGAAVFDCDAIYHELLQTDAALLSAIEAAFPGAVQGGVLDRKALGARVFGDPEALARLTALTQPAVAAEVRRRIAGAGVILRDSSSSTARRVSAIVAANIVRHPPPAVGADALGGPARSAPSPDPNRPVFAVIDAIGLFESGLDRDCDWTVAVLAPPETRIARLMARDNISEAYARARVAAQPPDAFYTSRADIVLYNDSTPETFLSRVEAICRRIENPGHGPSKTPAPTTPPHPVGAGVLDGPARSAPSPGPARSAPSPGPARSAPSPDPARSAPSPGPARSAPSPDPACPPSYPKRKKLRLEGYDYNSAGVYFLTICTKNKEKRLGDVLGGSETDLPVMRLSREGVVVAQVISSIDNARHVHLKKYVVMPNHIHLLLSVEKNPQAADTPQNAVIPHVVSTFKRFCEKRLGEDIFQRSYNDRIVRDARHYEIIWNYMTDNPRRWKEDRYYLE